MDISGTAKSPNLSFRYNANNEELEELFDICDDDPPTTQVEPSSSVKSDNASPKKTEKSPSIIDKYFKSRNEKSADKLDDVKGKDVESKLSEEGRTPPKDVTLSPVKEYLSRLSKKSASEAEAKEGGNETWKIFHDFKFKISQAVEDIKTRSGEDIKEKSVPRDNSVSDSEENSAVKDIDVSIGDTDNQVSSLDSSIQNLSEISQPLTAKATELEISFRESSRHNSESSDYTHMNIGHSYAADLKGQYMADSNALEVESGVEALEDNVNAFGDLSGLDPHNPNETPRSPPDPKSSPQDSANFGIPPNDKKDNNAPLLSAMKRKSYFLTYGMYFLTILLVVTFILFPNSNVWNGFLLGIWFYYVISNIKHYITDTYFGDWEPYQQMHAQVNRSSDFPINTMPTVHEHQPPKKYEGWINHYRAASYDPYSYHINQTTTAFMKLDGLNLRISYTQTKIPKRALWNEEIEKVVFYQHRLYNLTGARVILLPRGLVRRRHWSKKYPICIILQDNEKIQVLEKESLAAERRASESIPEKRRDSHESEGTETSTPEKKKKFVWRKKDKSVSNSECEPSNKDNKDSNKEGLRQRLVRKMHRDKKPDSVSTGTDVPESPSPPERPPERPLDDTFHDAEGEASPPPSPLHKEEDEEIDETEMLKIREFLEETDLEVGETAEGDWSLHVKYSDKNSHLYIFTRTGRDKHEWYRRLNNAVLEGTTPDSTDSEELTPESMKEAVETMVYKVSEQNIAFRPDNARSYGGLHHESILEGVTFSTDRTYAMERNVESLFWPYILKVIQNHEIMSKETKEAAVMCEIEPSALNRSKSKKKKAKTPSTCECRTLLPLEVTWLNTLVARLVYDIMRDPIMNARLHTRIQKKLHTLKLPSFMSPLVVTQLSLTGACPMVEKVSPPTWDERGVWLDADLRYDGGAYITILTQINLMKLKEKNVTLEERLMSAAAGNLAMDFGSHTGFSEHHRKPRIAACDSEMEDSAESSEDDESPPIQPVDSSEKLPATSEARLSQDATAAASGSSKKKFLRMVDKIATNKYFQQVTDYKYVKRAMEGLSNTDIKLQIEVHGLEGRLAFNLPPPPHDRIWFGFRTNPQLILKARPAVGQRALRFSHISNWIEQKLTKEFEKVMVLPNMEDILIDVMTPTPIEFE